MEMMKSVGGWRSERGSELIEFAMVAPILILLAAGIFEFGMMFRTYEAVTNAAREGARVGVLPAYEAHAPVEGRVNAFLTASGLTGPRTVTSLPVVTVATPAGTFSARRVVVTYTYQPVVLAPIGAAFGGSFGAIPLRGVSVMRTEAAAAP
jgi:Flp pilus assembly protein TadG